MREPERGPGANARASAMLCGGVALFSLFPVAAALWGRDASFTFSAGLFIGGSAGFAVFLLIRFRGLLRDREIVSVAFRRCWGSRMALWVCGHFDIALFTLSIGFIDVAVAAVLFELSPFMLCLIMAWLYRRERRYRNLSWAAIVGFALGLLGAGMVILSQTNVDIMGDIGAGALDGAMALGSALAVLGAALAAVNGVGFKWATDLAAGLARRGGYDRKGVEVFSVGFGVMVSNTLAVPPVALLAFWRGEGFASGALLGGFVAGVVLAFPYSALQRAAMLSTDSLGVGVIRYFLPLMTLGWLGALGLMGEVAVALLCAGAVVILAANVGAALFGWSRERRDAA